MNTLLAYLNGLSKTARQAFCVRCGTTEGYLRKAVSKGARLGESLCISLDRESQGQVRCDVLRPDVDWAYLSSAARVVAEAAHG